ncbi:hypothetical protein [Pseudomonas glycinae]|uniref:hypothetical protein n=1 Tax=Pseudomonas glycinae TaxID=1785145 RepID=UPI00167DFFCC|nr:hypothetical protein [Pseudomonas glycinae]
MLANLAIVFHYLPVFIERYLTCCNTLELLNAGGAVGWTVSTVSVLFAGDGDAAVSGLIRDDRG